MQSSRLRGALVAAPLILLVAACQPQMQRSAIGQNYGGMQERQLRAVELKGIEAGANPGVQNPPVTGVNPGTTGIERAPTGGEGNMTAGAPIAVNPGTTGIIRQRGVGAPTR
jgi:hypothetical protein